MFSGVLTNMAIIAGYIDYAIYVTRFLLPETLSILKALNSSVVRWLAVILLIVLLYLAFLDGFWNGTT